MAIRTRRECRSIAIAIAMAALGTGAGCRPSNPSNPSTLAESIESASDRMHTRFAGARATQLAIALGDLDRARSEARRIAAQNEPDLLPQWHSYIDKVGAAAAQVVASEDTITAAKTMAQLGRACARCHEATNANVAIPAQPATIVAGSEMATHQWAAARMWEGLIAPSDAHWTVGARALAETSLATSGAESGVSHHARRMKVLAERAVDLRDRNDWTTLYGELLATCASCHATIRDPSGHSPIVGTRVPR